MEIHKILELTSLFEKADYIYTIIRFEVGLQRQRIPQRSRKGVDHELSSLNRAPLDNEHV